MIEREHEGSFEGPESVKPPALLFERIMKRIGVEKKIAASKRKAAYFTIALACSAAALFAAFFSLEGALIQSEILKLLSVIAMDPGTAAANWQNFGLFFLESFPVAYAAIFLFALFILLESLTYIARNTSELFSLARSVKQN
jgi:hypothetical protein